MMTMFGINKGVTRLFILEPPKEKIVPLKLKHDCLHNESDKLNELTKNNKK